MKPVDGLEGSVSRLTKLSRRQPFRTPSSAEMEQAEVERKRRELKDLMKKNERTCLRAINYPEMSSSLSTSQVLHSVSSEAPSTSNSVILSSKVTRPQEFALSCPSTPRAASVRAASVSSEEGGWSHSLRTPARAKSWRPQLTLPESPRLRTAQRSRSASSRSSSCPPDSRAASRPRSRPPPQVSQRERTAVERHRERTTRVHRALPEISLGSWSARSTCTAGTEPSDLGSTHSSVYEASTTSRFSQLSQRSSTKHIPKSEELEKMEIERKRRELRDLRHQNERTYRHAISNPMLASVSSLRTRQPQLTVPVAPDLSTAHRPRSRSASRCSRDRSPDVSPDGKRANSGWVRSASTLEERAERARLAAQAKVDTPSEVSQYCIFRSPESAEARAQQARAAAISKVEADGRPPFCVFRTATSRVGSKHTDPRSASRKLRRQHTN